MCRHCARTAQGLGAVPFSSRRTHAYSPGRSPGSHQRTHVGILDCSLLVKGRGQNPPPQAQAYHPLGIREVDTRHGYPGCTAHTPGPAASPSPLARPRPPCPPSAFPYPSASPNSRAPSTSGAPPTFPPGLPLLAPLLGPPLPLLLLPLLLLLLFLYHNALCLAFTLLKEHEYIIIHTKEQVIVYELPAFPATKAIFIRKLNFILAPI